MWTFNSGKVYNYTQVNTPIKGKRQRQLAYQTIYYAGVRPS